MLKMDCTTHSPGVYPISLTFVSQVSGVVYGVNARESVGALGDEKRTW